MCFFSVCHVMSYLRLCVCVCVICLHRRNHLTATSRWVKLTSSLKCMLHVHAKTKLNKFSAVATTNHSETFVLLPYLATLNLHNFLSAPGNHVFNYKINDSVRFKRFQEDIFG